MTRGSYLIVAYEIGKRTKVSCQKLFDKVFDRIQLHFPDMKIEIFSDRHDDYTNTIPEYYAETCVDYGQVIKIREGGRIVDKIKIGRFSRSSMELGAIFQFSIKYSKLGHCPDINWIK